MQRTVIPVRDRNICLPLIEAALFGVPVITADLPYAHEVLHEYHNAVFCAPDNAEQWKTTIQAAANTERTPLPVQTRNTWEDFFNLGLSLGMPLECGV